MLGALRPRLSPSAGSAVFERALCSISGAAPQSSRLLCPGPSAARLSSLPFPPLKAQTAGALLLSAPLPSSASLPPVPPVLCTCSAAVSSSLCLSWEVSELFFQSAFQFTAT